jgi:hypothetical protein
VVLITLNISELVLLFTLQTDEKIKVVRRYAAGACCTMPFKLQILNLHQTRKKGLKLVTSHWKIK